MCVRAPAETLMAALSVEANPQPIQLWGLKRHFRRLDDKSQNLAATFRVCVCEMFCVSAFGKCCFCADHMLMPGQPHFWSSHFNALVPPGVILLGFSWASALGDRFCSHETNHSLKMTGSCVEVNLPYTEDISHIKPEKMCHKRLLLCMTDDGTLSCGNQSSPAASYYKVKVFRSHSSSATWS